MIRDIWESVREGLRETTLAEVEDEDEIVGGVPKVDEVKLQKPWDDEVWVEPACGLEKLGAMLL